MLDTAQSLWRRLGSQSCYENRHMPHNRHLHPGALKGNALLPREHLPHTTSWTASIVAARYIAAAFQRCAWHDKNRKTKILPRSTPTLPPAEQKRRSALPAPNTTLDTASPPKHRHRQVATRGEDEDDDNPDPPVPVLAVAAVLPSLRSHSRTVLSSALVAINASPVFGCNGLRAARRRKQRLPSTVGYTFTFLSRAHAFF